MSDEGDGDGCDDAMCGDGGCCYDANGVMLVAV